MGTAEEFLATLALRGGSIVSTSACTDLEIVAAANDGRLFINNHGVGFVLRLQGRESNVTG